jgi:hypothetical protein
MAFVLPMKTAVREDDGLSGLEQPLCAIYGFATLGNVKHSMQTPKMVEEALAELESKVGAKGRRKFEKFLREVAEDEDEDVDSK